MDEKIIDIMKRVLATSDITAGTSQLNCGKWDSLHHLTLIVELEAAFNIEFEPEEIAEMQSFEAVRRIILEKQD